MKSKMNGRIREQSNPAAVQCENMSNIPAVVIKEEYESPETATRETAFEGEGEKDINMELADFALEETDFMSELGSDYVDTSTQDGSILKTESVNGTTDEPLLTTFKSEAMEVERNFNQKDELPQTKFSSNAALLCAAKTESFHVTATPLSGKAKTSSVNQPQLSLTSSVSAVHQSYSSLELLFTAINGLLSSAACKDQSMSSRTVSNLPANRPASIEPSISSVNAPVPSECQVAVKDFRIKIPGRQTPRLESALPQSPRSSSATNGLNHSFSSVDRSQSSANVSLSSANRSFSSLVRSLSSVNQSVSSVNRLFSSIIRSSQAANQSRSENPLCSFVLQSLSSIEQWFVIINRTLSSINRSLLSLNLPFSSVNPSFSQVDESLSYIDWSLSSAELSLLSVERMLSSLDRSRLSQNFPFSSLGQSLSSVSLSFSTIDQSLSSVVLSLSSAVSNPVDISPSDLEVLKRCVRLYPNHVAQMLEEFKAKKDSLHVQTSTATPGDTSNVIDESAKVSSLPENAPIQVPESGQNSSDPPGTNDPLPHDVASPAVEMESLRTVNSADNQSEECIRIKLNADLSAKIKCKSGESSSHELAQEFGFVEEFDESAKVISRPVSAPLHVPESGENPSNPAGNNDSSLLDVASPAVEMKSLRTVNSADNQSEECIRIKLNADLSAKIKCKSGESSSHELVQEFDFVDVSAADICAMKKYVLKHAQKRHAKNFSLRLKRLQQEYGMRLYPKQVLQLLKQINPVEEKTAEKFEASREGPQNVLGNDEPAEESLAPNSELSVDKWISQIKKSSAWNVLPSRKPKWPKLH